MNIFMVYRKLDIHNKPILTNQSFGIHIPIITSNPSVNSCPKLTIEANARATLAGLPLSECDKPDISSSRQAVDRTQSSNCP